ncbi:MAG: TylF/MycF/NovP-related O-methyltransferase [Chloroflexota bacterium]
MYLLYLRFFHPDVYGVITRVRREKLTYLNTSALVDLYRAIHALEVGNRQGMLIEAGCAFGGSALVMAASKQRERPLRIYDTFGMIPSPSEIDGCDAHTRYAEIIQGQASGIRGEPYYGYEPDLLDKVKADFQRFGYLPQANHIEFIPGLFQDTLHVDQPVALAHIDCDWYDSVMTCLQRLAPFLISGGVLIIDDYFTWSGCRTAVDTYFAEQTDRYAFILKSRLHILRR